MLNHSISRSGFNQIDPMEEGWTSQDWLRADAAEEGRRRNQSNHWLRLEEMTIRNVSGSICFSQTPVNALQQAQIDQEVDQGVLIGDGGAVA